MSLRASTSMMLALLAAAAACNAVTGADQLAETDMADEAGAPPSPGDGPAPGDASSPVDANASTDANASDANTSVDADASPDAASPVVTGFAYRRAITLTSDAPPIASGRPVLVVIPSTFDYAHVKPNGDDLRFRSPDAPQLDLPYWIERWSPGGQSFVWVRPQVIPTGQSVVFAFYGKDDALPQSSFTATFPKAQRTAGGGAGSFTATAHIDVDWFELRAGDTLTLAEGQPLTITAQRIIIAGNIEGTGRGHAGGSGSHQDGTGPGAGSAGSTSDGSGGGGYGGSGGRGGSDAAEGGGAGGPTYGTAAGADIAMGSGGASADRAGGAGGGAISLFGWRTTVTGAIRMNGVDGLGLSGQNAGGGSGGGIFIAAGFLDLGGATLEAKGGAGGPCQQSANDGGGGGGGGRIKLRRRANGAYVAPTTLTVSGGPRGAGANTTAPGVEGSAGTIHIDQASTAAKGVETVVGPEEPTG